jgi:hypothetical protein
VSFDLNACTGDCLSCVRAYKKKHKLSGAEKDPFRISCSGIPKHYVSEDLHSILPEDEIKTAEIHLDPVKWAAEYLDWHCLDPDGEIWKRKNPEEYYDWVKAHPGENILGHSRYHRPYQSAMLKCSSRRKVSRIGRQVGKSETLVISILFNMFTKPGVSETEGFRVVVITPYQSQIDLIFNRMDELIRTSAQLQNSVNSRTKSPPCKLVLNNHSMITGFTAGTKSGGNADSVRGQKANMLVLDEADYLNPGDLDSALSIITNFPNATLWMSSTPKGTRDKFFNACGSRIYKEFHFSSTVNPLWGPELEATFREQLTEVGYKHEVLAEFSEQEEGVFQNVYIDAAKSDFAYRSIPRNDSWRYMIGVDWNDVKIGTSIAIVGYNPVEMCFYLVDKQRVSRDGWNQTAACYKIAELNQFWQPEYIYVDSGFGGTQVENLRLYGWESLKTKGPGHPDSRLRDIVKPYAFGGTIEVHDLITKQPIKKAAKPFLVENTVRKFERGVFRYPKSDDLFTKQLLGYIVDHTTVAGLPVYKASDETVGDHDLDAVLLALVAFTLETTELGKPKYSIDFAFSGKIGERVIPKEPDAGWISVTDTKKVDPRANNRPTLERTKEFEDKKQVIGQSSGLPGANLGKDTDGVKLWSWPGWERDAPRPTSSVRKNGFGTSVKVARPTRKNI